VRNPRGQLVQATVNRRFVQKNSIEIGLHRSLDYQRS
jgi:hypothetical protein